MRTRLAVQATHIKKVARRSVPRFWLPGMSRLSRHVYFEPMSKEQHKGGAAPLIRRLEKLVIQLKKKQFTASYEELSKRLGVSLRTVKRDVDFLRKRGYQIEYQKSSGFSMVEPSGAMREMLREHTGELLPAIALMRSMLQSVSKMNPGSGAGDLLNQFCHLLEQHGINLDQIGNYISSTAQPMPARLLPTFRSVVKALLEKKKLLIHYKSNKDPKPQERCIHPYHLIENEGRWYCLAYCNKSRDRRMYALWRIEKAVVQDTSFERPSELDAVQFWEEQSQVFGIWVNGELKVEIVLRMKGYAARLLEESSYRPKAMKVRRPSADPESVRVSFYVSAFEDVVPWIMRWGAYCEVVSPPELREIVATQARRMLSLYESSNG
jgi:predicted DNA-binding transcriptional regulator YafY